MVFNNTWHEEGVASEGIVNTVIAYRRLNTRRAILTTKLSNLQLKIWHNWQQTICKRIADGLDARVMSLGDNSSNSSNSKNNNTNGGDHLSGASGNYTFGANFRSAITAALAQSANHNSRNNNSNKLHMSNGSNNVHKQNRSYIKDAPKSSAKAKSLQINFSSDLFGLLQEVKYLLAMQQANGVRRDSNDINPNNLSTFEAAGVMATTQAQHELENQSATVEGAGEVTEGFEDSNSMELTAEVTTPLAAATNTSLTQQQGPNALESNLLDLYAKRDEFWQRKVKLIKICEFYNGIRGLSTDDACDGGIIGSAAELQLIRHEVNTIDELVEEACATLTWRTYGKR